MRARWWVPGTTRVFGRDVHASEAAIPEPGSIVHYLHEKFNSVHPLSSRHLKLFQMVQKSGQAWSAYYAKWEEAYRNADMDGMLV